MTEELGANRFLLEFKCGHKYDTRTAEYNVAHLEDMILKALPHTRAEVEHVEHSKEAKLRKFFKEVQPDDGEDTYLIEVMSLIVSDIRTDHFFLFFQGGCSNGKTMI